MESWFGMALVLLLELSSVGSLVQLLVTSKSRVAKGSWVPDVPRVSVATLVCERCSLGR